MEMTTFEINGKTYFHDSVGNLILEENVRQSSQQIRTPKDIIHFLSAERADKQENVIVFTLDGGNKMINKHNVGKGIANSCTIHPREIFHAAIKDSAVSIMLVHNHPSGNKEASESDLAATKRLVEAGKLLGIPVLDHVIVTPLDFTSIREHYPHYFG